jgi:Flp pilus assembly protein TadD
MLRTLGYTVASLSLLWGVYWACTEMRRREDAHELAREAEQVLSVPLSRVPELAKIQAARAVMLLDDAEALHEEPRSRALLAWAHALDEFQKSRFDRAEKALAEAKRTLPKIADLDVLQAAIAIRTGHPEAAASPLARALGAEPGNLRAQQLAADLATDHGEPAHALSLLEGLIARLPKLGSLYNRRGVVREALGDLDGAEADYAQATLLDGSAAQPYVNLGRLERGRGEAREAEASFARALDRSDTDPEAWLGRGLSRIALGDLVGGELDVQHARDLAPAEPAPLIALGDIDTHRGRLDAALDHFRAAVTLGPGDAVAWLKLGNTLARQQKYADARPAFEHALALQPGLSAAHNGLGAAFMALGDTANAERAFATAAELDSHDPNPLRNLALLRKRQGDVRASRDAHAEALARADAR